MLICVKETMSLLRYVNKNSVLMCRSEIKCKPFCTGPDEELFSQTVVGCTASYFVKIIWCSRWFCNPPILRVCIALFAVAEGWLLLDIGWFILFMIKSWRCLSISISMSHDAMLNVSLYVTSQWRKVQSVFELIMFSLEL